LRGRISSFKRNLKRKGGDPSSLTLLRVTEGQGTDSNLEGHIPSNSFEKTFPSLGEFEEGQSTSSNKNPFKDGALIHTEKRFRSFFTTRESKVAIPIKTGH
jgi:hypothetical protein